MPRIEGASYSIGAPLDSWLSVPLFRANETSEIRMASHPSFIAVSPEYFSTTGTRIVAGRGFASSDVAASAPVMIVSESMARWLWPDRNPLGECLVPLDRTKACHRVVGIAADAHTFRIIEELGMQFYFPVAQAPGSWAPRNLLVRAGDATPSLVAAIRIEVARMIPGAQVTVRSMSQILEPQLRPWRLGAQLFGALSVLAVVVAGIGVYSVVAFAVRRRMHEMGVRVALGAQPADLLRLVLAQGSAVVAAGAVVGVIVALAAGKLVAALLYGVTPRDPIALSAGAAFLVTLGVAASLIPAWRASRVDPARVLREE
jgi:hypothetical protein